MKVFQLRNEVPLEISHVDWEDIRTLKAVLYIVAKPIKLVQIESSLMGACSTAVKIDMLRRARREEISLVNLAVVIPISFFSVKVLQLEI